MAITPHTKPNNRRYGQNRSIAIQSPGTHNPHPETPYDFINPYLTHIKTYFVEYFLTKYFSAFPKLCPTITPPKPPKPPPKTSENRGTCANFFFADGHAPRCRKCGKSPYLGTIYSALPGNRSAKISVFFFFFFFVGSENEDQSLFTFKFKFTSPSDYLNASI